MADDGPPHEELEALLRLQEAETTIRRLEKRLDELPEQAVLDESITTSNRIKADADATRVEIDLVEGEIRKLENELETLQTRRAKDQQRMYGGEITNPKELQAVRAELDSIAGRIDESETTLLEVMQQREELVGRIDAFEQRRTELGVEQVELERKRDEAAKEILAELAETRASRDRQREAIADHLLERYEAKKERHGGVGVGQLEGGICTACRMELTPLERSNARDEGPVWTCPQCQRLLVVLD